MKGFAPIAALVVVVAGLLCGLPFAAVVTVSGAVAGGTAERSTCPVPSTGPVGRWSAAQTTNAAIIIGVGKSVRMPVRGWIVAVATAMQESNLRNLANDNSAYPDVARISQALPHEGVGRDHDSVGLFQQRPIEGDGSWGPVAELMDPRQSAAKFYAALARVQGWTNMPITVAAQAVQRSSFPDYYAKWVPDAEAMVEVLSESAGRCGAAVNTQGWTKPVPAGISSPFGPRGGALHAGVDLSPPRGTAIRAVHAGTVVTMMCDVSVGTCDQDGSPSVGGCGWYVDIAHPGDIVSRYCHMLKQPEVRKGQTVAAGDVIGFVGTSGNSSGPHLHFEIHTSRAADNSDAIDPVPFMRSRGVTLG